MAKRLVLAAAAAALWLFIYLLEFKTLDNEDIMSYGWKDGGCFKVSEALDFQGGDCYGLPGIIDFQGGDMTLRGDELYDQDILIGRIVERKYRIYAEPYIVIQSQSGEMYYFVGKWSN
ncbi:hypothetical protein C4J81_05430 [Deltaproteobacteria bacterium Smac51]|nr:hypothetical protein C4J81_05430 [Deltaproteobacteria bacterium Smac51]